MKKCVIRVIVLALCLSLLSGCALQDKLEELLSGIPVGTDQPSTAPGQAPGGDTTPAGAALGAADSYWVAYEYTGENSYDQDGPTAIDESRWLLDLIIRSDGTAQLRDIYGELYLAREADQFLSWERDADGSLRLFSETDSDISVSCRLEGDILVLEYLSEVYRMKQRPVPQQIGELYAPAQLRGSWMMVSTEVEGAEFDASLYELEGLVFELDASGEEITLKAHIETMGPFPELCETHRDLPLTVLKEPLYDGCENGSWSVRLGDASVSEGNGQSGDTEYYVTLLDYNTLLMQRYYIMDGLRAVSYQTYRRILPRESWWSISAAELVNSGWTCVWYQDAGGNLCPAPAGMEDFRIRLNGNGVCTLIRPTGETTVSWALGSGGLIQLRGSDMERPEQWFKGAVRACYTETDTGTEKTHEMYLYLDGGVLCLVMEDNS